MSHGESRAASFSRAVVPEMGQLSRLAELQPPCLEECIGWFLEWGRWCTRQSLAQLGTLHTAVIHHNHPLASTCSTHLAPWIMARLGSKISYKSPPQNHFELQQHQVRPRTHSGSRRRVEAAAALRTAVVSLTTHVRDRFNLMWVLSGPYVKTNNICHFCNILLSRCSTNSAAGLLPTAKRANNSVGAGTESIKACCVLVQLSPLVGR